MAADIRIGTCSWADDALSKHWYPPGTKAAERLPYYAEHFDTVEVDSTYYRLPSEEMVERWAERTPEGFVMHVKAFGLMTRHPVKLESLPPDLRDEAPTDERLVSSIFSGVAVAFIAAVANHSLRLHLLSRLAERIVFVLVPPLALIFLVLGTIFLGVATPTEGGAMGASGALIMAVARRRLSWRLLKQAMDTTAKLSTFVVFILIGARVFSLTFYAVNGHVWVEHLLGGLPGGQLGFLIVVNIVIFVLAFALGCALSSIYGFLSGAWPFGVIEIVWTGVALRRWRVKVYAREAQGEEL